MITDDCAKLSELLSQVENAKRNEQLVNKLSERKAEVRKLRDKLLASTNRLAPLRSRDAKLEQLPDASSAFTRVTTMRETLAQNPADITKGRDFTTLRTIFEKLADKVDTVVETAWPDFVERFRAKTDKTQLKQCETFSTHATTVRRIEALEIETKRLQRRPPQNEEAMKALEGKWEEIRDLVKSLPAVNSDPEIQAFIDAANSRDGASLDLLSSKVRAWLAEQKMTAKFRIMSYS
jgi:FtsZ-binding cell division protein ZapB